MARKNNSPRRRHRPRSRSFPQGKSPGGREWDFHNNAESFLLICEAMGGAIKELMDRN